MKTQIPYSAVLVAILMLWVPLAQADERRVLTCESEWAALVKALTDDEVSIDSATHYRQDPHAVQARPSLIAKARRADLLVCSGADLEAGWLPLLLRKSSNKSIQPNELGYFMAAEQVSLLNAPARLDRAHGDVHSAGNPHVHLDPRRMMTIAQKLSYRMKQLWPDKRDILDARLAHFNSAMEQMLRDTANQQAALNERQVVVQHDSWVYLFDWLNISQLAELEPKPGLPPSTAHMASLLEKLANQPADLIIYASYQDPRAAEWFSKQTGVAAVELPYSVEDWTAPNALPKFYQQLLTTMEEGMPQRRQSLE